MRKNKSFDGLSKKRGYKGKVKKKMIKIKKKRKIILIIELFTSSKSIKYRDNMLNKFN